MIIKTQPHWGALSILLYELHQERNKELTEWSKHQEDYFLRGYGLETINTISDAIKYYFSNKDIDLQLIHPSSYATTEEKERFLRYVLDGFIKSGFVDHNVRFYIKSFP